MAILIIGTWVATAGAQTPPADVDLAGGGHFYTQANGGAGAQYGYRITDEGGIGMWSEFQRLGGVTALGYPSSKRFTMDGFVVQATQKVILQWRPEVSQVYFVNVFDKLHDMGLDSALQQTYQIPAQLPATFDAGKTQDQVQAARVALLNADASIAGQYNASSNPLVFEGLPTSNVTNEGPFSSVRLQRVAIQHWNTAGPGGIKAGDVSVVNGGDIAKAMGLVPASAAIPETIAGVSAATPTAVPTPQPTLPPYTYKVTEVTQPPVDCSSDPTASSVPCSAVLPNAGAQYIKGRVMDQKGNHLVGVTVQANIVGACNNNGQTVDCIQQVQTAGDGTFTFNIAGSGSPTGACPPYTLRYNVMVVNSVGAQDSDIRNVVYDGNCNSDGEFHFDFVKVR
jgi:hypothetical protein